MAKYEVIIIGGGPAGLTAGLYSARAGLKTILLERGMFGGQIVNAHKVENYPGFPDGISGFDLVSLMHKQAIKYGLEIINAEATGLITGKPHNVLTADGEFAANTVIIAAGSEYIKLGIDNEKKFVGRGVSYCATCDGAFFKDRDVAVVGGGDTAITDALELTQHASKIYVIHRRDQLRASQILQQQALAHPKLKFVWNSVVEDINGEAMVKELKLKNVKTSEISTIPVSGVFVAIGVKPNSQKFADVVKIDETGNIMVDPLMATSVAGIYAIGDIRQNSPRQVATAVGDGTTAAIAAFKYIRERI
jgi:thioredoxin reductase (NADPH)